MPTLFWVNLKFPVNLCDKLDWLAGQDGVKKAQAISYRLDTRHNLGYLTSLPAVDQYLDRNFQFRFTFNLRRSETLG